MTRRTPKASEPVPRLDDLVMFEGPDGRWRCGPTSWKEEMSGISAQDVIDLMYGRDLRTEKVFTAHSPWGEVDHRDPYIWSNVQDLRCRCVPPEQEDLSKHMFYTGVDFDEEGRAILTKASRSPDGVVAIESQETLSEKDSREIYGYPVFTVGGDDERRDDLGTLRDAEDG